MKSLRLSLLFLTLFAAGNAFAATEAGRAVAVRTFQFKYKSAEKAAAAVKALMSAEGTFSVQPSTNALVVTDSTENLKAIAAAIAQFDTAPQTIHLKVRIVAASRSEAPVKVPDDLKDIAGKLAVLRLNSLESLGDINAEGKEGDPSIVDLPSGYRADFRFGEFDPASDTIHISDFKLLKLQGEKKDQLSQILKTSLNVKVGQTVILSASRGPESPRTIMIVVSATR